MWDFRYNGSVCRESLDWPKAETESAAEQGARVIWEHPCVTLTSHGGPRLEGRGDIHLENILGWQFLACVVWSSMEEVVRQSRAVRAWAKLKLGKCLLVQRLCGAGQPDLSRKALTGKQQG